MSSDAGRTKAVAADYLWAEGDGLFSAYCLTLVRGVTQQEFMDRLGARIMFDALRLGEQFTEISFGYWGEPHFGDVQFIGATTVAGDGGHWTLALEVNGHLGVTPEMVIPVSAETTLVSHRYNGGNAASQFCWIENGGIRLDFDPLFAGHRDGSTPNALVDDMQQAGFNLDESREDAGPITAASFALAERLTGVRVTEAMLDEAVFLCGTARLRPPDPRG
jgi:Family of unknown function (DUF6461)